MELSAVVIPTRTVELSALIDVFNLWNNESCRPFVSERPKPVQLILSLNGQKDVAYEQTVLRAFDGCHRMKRGFSKISFLYCNLEAIDDLYTRSNDVKLGMYGKVSGPNLQFFNTLRLLSNLSGPILYIEVDVRPLRHNWLEKVQLDVRHSDRFWMLGSYYHGLSQLSLIDRSHLNGNAIYAVNDQEFQHFAADIWKPFLVSLISKYPYAAYDHALAHLIEDYKERGVETEVARLKYLIRQTAIIRNYGGEFEKKNNYGIRLQDIITVYPQAVLVHGAYLSRDQEKPSLQNTKAYYENILSKHRGSTTFNMGNLKKVYQSPRTDLTRPEQLAKAYNAQRKVYLTTDTASKSAELDTLRVILHNLSSAVSPIDALYSELYKVHNEIDSDYKRSLLRLSRKKIISLSFKEKLECALGLDRQCISELVALQQTYVSVIREIDNTVVKKLTSLMGKDFIMEKKIFDREYIGPKTDFSYFSSLGKALALSPSVLFSVVKIYLEDDNAPRVLAFNTYRMGLLEIISIEDAAIVEKIMKGKL